MLEETNNNHPHWQAYDTHPELCELLKESLREIEDPEISLNVTQLGLIRNLVIEDNHATITMLLTTPFCPYGPDMINSVQQKAEDVLGMSTHVDLSLDPWDMSMMEDGLSDDWGMFRQF